MLEYHPQSTPQVLQTPRPGREGLSLAPTGHICRGAPGWASGRQDPVVDDAGRSNQHPLDAQLQDQNDDVLDEPGGWRGRSWWHRLSLT